MPSITKSSRHDGHTIVLDLLEEVGTDADVFDAGHRGDVLDVVDETIDGVDGRVEEPGVEVDADDAATGGDVLELGVG